jgi:drug/metabolite transporter (DMT)-like permease
VTLVADPSVQTRTSVLPTLAAAAAVTLTGSVFVVMRHIGRDLSPGAVSLGRLLVGSVLLGIYAYTRPRVRLKRSDWPPLIACGVLWFGIYNLALNAATRWLDAGTAAMLINLTPLLIVVLAGLFLREGFPGRLLAGTVVAVAGVVAIGVSASTGQAAVRGVVLCLAAALCQAIAVILQKPLLGRIPGGQMIWLACTIGAVSCLPFAPALISEVRTAPVSSLLWVVFLAAFPTTLAHILWAYALARSSAGRTGAMAYLSPPVAVLLAWLFLAETPAMVALAGGILCLTGVVLASWRPTPVTRAGSRRSRG